jgi:hypothetical protein
MLLLLRENLIQDGCHKKYEKFITYNGQTDARHFPIRKVA